MFMPGTGDHRERVPACKNAQSGSQYALATLLKPALIELDVKTLSGTVCVEPDGNWQTLFAHRPLACSLLAYPVRCHA